MASFSEAVNSHIKSALKDLYTTMPGIVEKVYVVDGVTVIDVQPALHWVSPDNRTFKEQVLKEVIVQWPSAGGCYITFPIEKGDSVMLHFAMKDCVDWKTGDGSAPVAPRTKRLHSVNDVFATPQVSTYRGGYEIDSEGVCIGSENVEVRILKDGTIELGKGATERLVKGDSFLSQFLSHTHTYSNAGTPTLTTPVSTVLSVPDTTGLWEDNLSDVSKTL